MNPELFKELSKLATEQEGIQREFAKSSGLVDTALRLWKKVATQILVVFAVALFGGALILTFSDSMRWQALSSSFVGGILAGALILVAQQFLAVKTHLNQTLQDRRNLGDRISTNKQKIEEIADQLSKGRNSNL